MTAILAVADGYRRSAFRLMLRVPGARDIFVSRERRIPVAEALCVAMATFTSLFFPVLSLWVGASLLGVPHVLSGIRHVAIRRSLHPLTKACIAVSIAVGALTLMRLTSGIPIFVGLFALSMGVEVLASRAGAGRRIFWLATVALGAGAAWHWPYFFIIGVSHLHALCSMSFFSTEARRRGIRVWPLWAMSIAVIGAVLVGVLDPLFAQTTWERSLGPDEVVSILGHVAGSSTPILLARSLFLYAFSQSLHYMVWLRLMPELDRRSPVPQSFRQALAGLRRDFGRWTVPALVLCAIGGVAMLLGGRSARDVYFVLVFFHIGLEAAGWLRLQLNFGPGQNSKVPPNLCQCHNFGRLPDYGPGHNLRSRRDPNFVT